MEDKKLAQRILDYVGGADNIESAGHCATRLRLVIKDQGIVDLDAIEQLEDVKGTFTTAGQFQIILGTGLVNRVFAEMVKLGNINQATTGEVARTAMKHLNPVQRLARVLSNIMVPIIPAIVASGLLMGALGYLGGLHQVDDSNGVVRLINMFANIAFIYLPILIAYSAAREFGGNPVLAAALGGFMVHPALLNAWDQAKMHDAATLAKYPNVDLFFGFFLAHPIDILGLHFDGTFAAIGYQGTVLPILLAVYFMSFVERGIRKIVPNILDILITPFATLVISGVVTFCVIGPAMRLVGEGISFGLMWTYTNLGPLAGIIFGGVYSAIVITGVHHSFHAIEAGMIHDVGGNYLLPIWSMSNVAQGGAAAAMFFKTKSIKIKAIALPAAVSCLLGITEAAIFGVNLKLLRPFYCALAGGAAGGAWVVANKVAMSAVGLTGFPGTLIVKNGGMTLYLIGMAIAFGVAFGLTITVPIPEDEADA